MSLKLKLAWLPLLQVASGPRNGSSSIRRGCQTSLPGGGAGVRQQEKQQPFAGASHWWTSRCVSAEWRNDGIKKSKEDNMFSKDLLLAIRGPLQLFLCTMHYLWPIQRWHPAICLLSERGCREKNLWLSILSRAKWEDKGEREVREECG